MNVARGGYRWALPFAVLAAPAALLSPWLAAAALALGAGVLAFFRDPDRAPPATGVVSPADGRVSVVRREGDRLRVGVFMNVWNVHVNRAPVRGEVASVEHVPGAHRPAFTKDSDRNERVHVDLGDVRLTLVAGAFARRIRPYVDDGDAVDRGQRVGHVAFGSRADVLLSPAVSADDLAVERGDAVRAGETVIARRPE